MADEHSPNDPYALVLADLRAQRDRIDTAINAIESLRGGVASQMASVASSASAAAASASAAIASSMGAGAFLGMTIVDAAKKLLAHERRQLNNSELVEKLKNGGLVLNSIDPLNTVGSVLNRRFQEKGDVVRVGRGTWGLKEWYPNRTFRSATAKLPEGARDANVEASDPPISQEGVADDLSDLLGSSNAGTVDLD